VSATVPLPFNFSPTVTATPGAFTKLVVDLTNSKIDTTTAAGITGTSDVYGVKPGNENRDSLILRCMTGDWAANCNTYTYSARATFGTIIDCHGFDSAGLTALGSAAVNTLMCVGEKQGAGYIFNVTAAAP